MYKVIGVDGKEYGPVSLEQLRQWQAQGRIGPQTRILEPGATEWKTAREIAGLADLLGPAPGSIGSSGPISPLRDQPPSKALAVTSFILGLVFCFGPLTAVPAIICGHVAHSRSRRSPAQFGGAGFAIAGLCLGYANLLLCLLLIPTLLMRSLATAKSRAQEIHCVNNLKQIGLGLRIWAVDHEDQFPFQVSTNAGGTLELAAPAADGSDRNSHLHFRLLAAELNTPRILVCVADTSKTAALGFDVLSPANVTYLLHTGPEVNETNPTAVLATCPIHGTRLFADGSVQSSPRKGQMPWDN